MDTICREYIKQTQMLFPIIRKKERIYLKSLYNTYNHIFCKALFME